jgi:alkyl sulfatase BDS1-like metallo-beta-lactamase superfamily hydrolase
VTDEPMFRSRPGAEAIRAAVRHDVEQVGDRIWVSPGLSNSFLIGTDDGAVVLNAGMGFEGPVHRDNYAALDAGPIRHLVLTQGHYDHVGGVDVLREDGTQVVAQARWGEWRADNERLAAFRTRNAAFAWTDAITAALAYAEEHGDGFAQASPEPDVVVDEHRVLEVGDRWIELLAVPGAETTDSLVVWLPFERTCFVGNLFGALFGHIPNLVTMRGDRYRDALTVVAAIDRVRALGADVLHTGHFGPITGAELIDRELGRLRDALMFVHDETVRGMNAGVPVEELVRTVVLPPELAVGEGYGKVSWNVRAIWENYAGWFHHRSTTELYAAATGSVAAELAELVGAEVVVGAGWRRLEDGQPVEALHLAEVALAAEPDDAAARDLTRAALADLLAASDNFWESAWLRREIERYS